MAVLSDANLLLNHIKNCFIYGDETGICEMLVDQEMPLNYNFHEALNDNYKFSSGYSDSHRKSPDIPCNVINTGRKSSAEIRISEVENEQKLVADDHYFIDTGQWPRNLDEKEVFEYFSSPVQHRPKQPSTLPKSSLTQMLQQADTAMAVRKENPFSRYAKFSAISYSRPIGNADSTAIDIAFTEVPTVISDVRFKLRDFLVHLWDHESQRDLDNPVKVRPIGATSVADFIGLVCWKYCEEQRQPDLPDVSIASVLELYMFEDVDDLEMDFGSLYREDDIYKYQFSRLALIKARIQVTDVQIAATFAGGTVGRRRVEAKDNVDEDDDDCSFVTQSHVERMGLAPNDGGRGWARTGRMAVSEEVAEEELIVEEDGEVLVEINMAHGSSKLHVSTQCTIRQIVQQTVEKRNLCPLGRQCQYRLESINEPGVELSDTMQLKDTSTRNFFLIRDMSKRELGKGENLTPTQMSEKLLGGVTDYLQIQQYPVVLKQTLRKFEARLTISNDSLLIEAVALTTGGSSRGGSGGLASRLIRRPKSVLIMLNGLADFSLEGGSNNNKVILRFTHIKTKLGVRCSSKKRKSQDGGVMTSNSSLTLWSDADSVQSQSSTSAVSDAAFLGQLTSHSLSCQTTVAHCVNSHLIGLLQMTRTNQTVRKRYLALIAHKTL